MKLILDTDKNTVTEEWSKRDKSLSKDEREADIANILAFAVAANAMKRFKKKHIMELYVMSVFRTCLSILDSNEDDSE